MKRVLYVMIPLGLLAGVLWVWPGYLRPSEEGESGLASYTTARVMRRDIGSTVLATGVIRPMVGAEVQVGSRVSGILQRLNVSIGDEVQGGQVLAELDKLEFQARYDQALALLETARVEAHFAKVDGDRAQELHAQGVISDMEMDGAKRAQQIAAASLSQAEANARSAEIQLDYTVIRAPVSGVVASVSTQVGETVAASFASPTFVTIIDLNRLEIWAYVDETDIGRVEVGQAATFTVDTYAGTEFKGTVTAIQPKAEIVDNVVNYVTLIEIGPTGGEVLRPEMTTTVNITLEGRNNVLTLPNGAVRRDADGLFAFVPGVDGLEKRTIQTGYRGRDHTEVLDGLAEGDEVIVGSVGNRS
jgi:macrolide-specific efflux system membrane fusion protein